MDLNQYDKLGMVKTPPQETAEQKAEKRKAYDKARHAQMLSTLANQPPLPAQAPVYAGTKDAVEVYRTLQEIEVKTLEKKLAAKQIKLEAVRSKMAAAVELVEAVDRSMLEKVAAADEKAAAADHAIAAKMAAAVEMSAIWNGFFADIQKSRALLNAYALQLRCLDAVTTPEAYRVLISTMERIESETQAEPSMAAVVEMVEAVDWVMVAKAAAADEMAVFWKEHGADIQKCLERLNENARQLYETAIHSGEPLPTSAMMEECTATFEPLAMAPKVAAAGDMVAALVKAMAAKVAAADEMAALWKEYGARIQKSRQRLNVDARQLFETILSGKPSPSCPMMEECTATFEPLVSPS